MLIGVNNGVLPRLITLPIHFRLRFNLSWAGQIVDNSIQNRLNSFILERRAAVGREEVQGDGALANAPFDIVYGELRTIQVRLHQVVILIYHCLDQFFTILFNLVDHVGGDITDVVLGGITGVIPDPRLAGQQINHTDKIVFGTDRQHHHQRVGGKHILNLFDDTVEVSTQAIQFVNENDAGHP